VRSQLKVIAFRELFHRSIDTAIHEAEAKFGLQLPKGIMIELHGVGDQRGLLNFEEAANLIFINEEIFHPVIDIGVRRIHSGMVVVFVRVSALPPVKFEKTWNSPRGMGPFKTLIPLAETLLGAGNSQN
jgi:hypothetical protein